MLRKMTALGFAVCLLYGAVAASQEDIPRGPCGSKPVAPPQFRKGGEGVPPLPLPATPLRRTERKRPPSPPVLIAKIQFGSLKELKVSDGILHYFDWNKDPADIPNLLNDAAERALNIHYTWKCGPLDAFTTDPSQYPIYYYTGSDDFTLSDADAERLREYVRAGGVIWGDTALGDPDFFKAFVREMSKVLPDRHFHRLNADHPLFNCYYPISKVSYNRPVPDAPNGEPVFYGVDLGARTAILLSRYGLSCGWDGHTRAGAYTVNPNDARKLGVNMIAYALAMYPISIYQGTAKIYYQEEERPRGEFVLAQARIGENWDSQFNEIASLLKTTATQTSAEIKFERKVVDLGKSDLQNYPFLYITGEYDFTLNAVEKRALKSYLAAGGFILASPSCGSREFDRAFRREVAGLLPGHPLQPLPVNHPVYSILNKIQGVGYAEYVEKSGETPPSLPLEGVSIGAATPIIYCPYGIGGGWRGFDNPFGRDIASEDATRLGVNIILYAMTH